MSPRCPHCGYALGDRAGLNERQKRALAFICNFIKRNDFGPTIREVADDLDTEVTSAQRAIDALIRAEYLARPHNGARSLTFGKHGLKGARDVLAA